MNISLGQMTYGVNDGIIEKRMGLQKYIQDSKFHGKKRITPFISTLTALSAVLVPKVSVILVSVIPHWSGRYNSKQRPYCSQV